MASLSSATKDKQLVVIQTLQEYIRIFALTKIGTILFVVLSLYRNVGDFVSVNRNSLTNGAL